jgi:hypothetical protein
MLRVTLRIFVCVALAVLTTSITRAASIWNVDLVSPVAMSGQAVVGAAGDYWNTANTTDAGSNLVILDSTGVSGPANIGLNFSAPGGNVFGFAAEGTANPAGLMDGFGSSVNGGGGTSFTQLSFAFSGLVPNTQYTVYGYGAAQSSTDRGTFFFGAVNSPILGFTSGASTDIATGANIAWDDFMISTDASGAFTINTNFNSNTSAQGPVNGFQIEGPAPVPEPASICLVAAVCLVMVCARKRLA